MPCAHTFNSLRAARAPMPLFRAYATAKHIIVESSVMRALVWCGRLFAMRAMKPPVDGGIALTVGGLSGVRVHALLPVLHDVALDGNVDIGGRAFGLALKVGVATTIGTIGSTIGTIASTVDDLGVRGHALLLVVEGVAIGSVDTTVGDIAEEGGRAFMLVLTARVATSGAIGSTMDDLGVRGYVLLPAFPLEGVIRDTGVDPPVRDDADEGEHALFLALEVFAMA